MDDQAGQLFPVIAYNSKDPLFHFTARRSWYAAGIEQKGIPTSAGYGLYRNWILNSTRGEDRFQDYDKVESLLFEKARQEGMGILAETYQGETIPSRPFVEGGIHEAIMEYENNVFFDILAEDLARRDMNDAPIDESNYAELTHRIEAYINEFEENGTDNILVDIDIAP